MKRIDKRESRRLTTCVYTDEAIRDARSAAECVARAARTEGYRARYIALRDLERGADEGNGSAQLRPGADAQAIADAMAASQCGRVYLSGQFEGVRAGVGIDLRTFAVSITVPNDRGDLADRLAGLLA